MHIRYCTRTHPPQDGGCPHRLRTRIFNQSFAQLHYRSPFPCRNGERGRGIEAGLLPSTLTGAGPDRTSPNHGAYSCILMSSSAMTSTMPELLTIREVARICRVHEVTIRRQIASGRLKAVRIGRQLRVKGEDVETLVGTMGAAEEAEAFKPLALDDPIFGLIGLVDIPELAGLSRESTRFSLIRTKASSDSTRRPASASVGSWTRLRSSPWSTHLTTRIGQRRPSSRELNGSAILL